MQAVLATVTILLVVVASLWIMRARMISKIVRFATLAAFNVFQFELDSFHKQKGQ